MSDAPKKTVIVADRDGPSKAMYRYFLRDEYNVVLCADGHEALQECYKHTANDALLLVDRQLLKTDGVEMVGKIKKHFPGFPMIMTTLNVPPNPKADDLYAWFDAVIPKPIDKDTLLKLTAELFAPKRESAVGLGNFLKSSLAPGAILDARKSSDQSPSLS